MKIAVPVTNKKLCLHFGHCDEFAIIEVDAGTKQILKTEYITPPPHEPGVLPKWLAGLNANVIIAGGMGMRAQDLFKENNIDVIVGVPAGDPEDLANTFLAGHLKSGENICDH